MDHYENSTSDPNENENIVFFSLVIISIRHAFFLFNFTPAYYDS